MIKLNRKPLRLDIAEAHLPRRFSVSLALGGGIADAAKRRFFKPIYIHTRGTPSGSIEWMRIISAPFFVFIIWRRKESNNAQ